MNKQIIAFIWIIFIIIFFILAIFHFKQAGKKINKFEVTKRPMRNGTVKIAGLDVDTPLENFAEDFNSYINNYNKLTKRQNIIQGIGYLIAMLVALFSMILSYE